MTKYNVTVTFHHNNPRSPWHMPVEANSIFQARAKAFQEVIKAEFGLVADIDDLKGVCRGAGEATIKCEDECCGGEFTNVTVWNQRDGKNLNLGCGVGDSINDTSKSENAWITVRKRDNTVEDLANAIRGQLHKLEKMEFVHLQDFLLRLDEIDG